MTAERIDRELAGGGEDRERDREVEARALLPQPGRGEVDGDAPGGPLELGRGDAAPDSVLRLLAGAVGKPDNREAREAVLEVRLDLDLACLETDEGMGNGAREHRPTLRGKYTHVCAGSEPSLRLSGRRARPRRTRPRAGRSGD